MSPFVRIRALTCIPPLTKMLLREIISISAKQYTYQGILEIVYGGITAGWEYDVEPAKNVGGECCKKVTLG